MTDVPSLRRDDLAQFFGSNPRLMRAMELHSAAVVDNSISVADTQALKDATVIVLSANGDFTNERVLQIGDGIDIDVTDSTVTFSVKDVARTRDHIATLIPPADVVVFLPPDGTLLSTTTIVSTSAFAGLGNYATDAAAATGGVAVGGLYHNAGAVRVRLT